MIRNYRIKALLMAILSVGLMFASCTKDGASSASPAEGGLSILPAEGDLSTQPTGTGAADCFPIGYSGEEDQQFTILPMPNGPDEGYVAILETLWDEDKGLNSDIKYLSVDLSKAMLDDQAPLMERLNTFCEINDLELLTLGYDDLTEQGYITDLYFTEGVLIAYEDTELTETRLVTSARKWRGGRAAVGAQFTAERDEFFWRVTKEENSWVS